VAAVITNLADEANLVDTDTGRAVVRVKRRQEMLRAAGNFANIAD
jgi:S-DNA-T family DNA segregation ATPase FtsK/SpoIIIE